MSLCYLLYPLGHLSTSFKDITKNQSSGNITGLTQCEMDYFKVCSATLLTNTKILATTTGFGY